MFTVCIPILNQHEKAVSYLDSWFSLAKGSLEVIFIDNGSDDLWSTRDEIKSWRKGGHRIRVIRNETNTGVYPTFQQGYDNILTPWCFYSHSDVEMLEYGWDEKLNRMLEAATQMNAGVCGMFGAKGIGTPDIYKSPYKFTQMMRWDCHTVDGMADAGGSAVKFDLTPCMVLDGFALIVYQQMLLACGGFDHESYPVHHMYDNDICLMSHYAGYRNFVLNIDCKHHGGVTSTHEDWAERMGTTDLAVHRASHEVFYEKWRGKLPVGV